MAQTPEGKVKTKVKKVLKAHGCYQFWPVQTGYGTTTLDALVCHLGRFIGIETKRPTVKKMTPRQGDIADEMRAAGGKVFLINTAESIAELDAWLTKKERKWKTKQKRKSPASRSS